MATSSFSRPGAVDLSALTGRATAPATSSRGRFTVEVTSEESLRAEVVTRSASVVVLVSFWATQSPDSVRLNETLSRLADEYDGRFVVATMDVAAHPDLARAMGVPGVPLVLAALQGQLAPLLQQALPEADLRQVIDQVLQAAAMNGVSGRVAPFTAEGAEESPEPESVSRHPEAEAALDSGDFDTAIARYEQAVKADPNDDEAKAGAVRVRLVKRTLGVDASTARQAAAEAPIDVDLQITAADVDLIDGRVDQVFDRLLALIEQLTGDDKDAVRVHLLDLFLVVGQDDPRVTRARQRLAAAVF
jgi:putative thioredoxin